MTFGPGCKMEDNFGPEWWRERTQEGRMFAEGNLAVLPEEQRL